MDPLSVLSQAFQLANSIYSIVKRTRHFKRTGRRLKERIELLMPIVEKLAVSQVHVPNQARNQKGLKLFSQALGRLFQLLGEIEVFLEKLQLMNFLARALRSGNIVKKFSEFNEELSISSQDIQLALTVEQRIMDNTAVPSVQDDNRDIRLDLEECQEELKNQHNENQEIRQILAAQMSKLERPNFGVGDLPEIDPQALQERELVDKGRFCDTYKAEYNHQMVAFKSYNVGQNKDFEKILRNEATNLRRLNSEYIVRLWGIGKEKASFLLAFEFMCKGSLRSVLDGVGSSLEELPAQRRIQMALDSAIGLYRLHSMVPRPLVHQNIGSDIFLVDENWAVKLSGVGFAQTKTSILKNSKQAMTKRSTLNYVPPERLANLNLPVNQEMDIYSFGIVLYEITSGKKPYEGMANMAIRNFVMEQKKLPVPDWCPVEFRDLIDSCRAFDKESRSEAADIVRKLKVIREGFEKSLQETE